MFTNIPINLPFGANCPLFATADLLSSACNIMVLPWMPNISLGLFIQRHNSGTKTQDNNVMDLKEKSFFLIFWVKRPNTPSLFYSLWVL